MRHARSSWEDPILADHKRPLVPGGREAARRVAVHLNQARIHPDVVLCSSATRALQTYDAIAPVLDDSCSVFVEDALYAASSTDLLFRLRDLPEWAETVLLIGHNPGLQALAVALVGDRSSSARLNERFPTGALATLTADTPWVVLGPGRAQLRSLIVPSELGRL